MDYSYEKERNILKRGQNKAVEDITQKYNKKNTRRSIPKILKNMIWDTNIGEEKGIGKCYCCAQKINSKHFEAGHIIAVKNGGQNTLKNLKPICGCCNKSMGTMNMELFKETYMSHLITEDKISPPIKNTPTKNTFILNKSAGIKTIKLVENPVIGSVTHRTTNTLIAKRNSMEKTKDAWYTDVKKYIYDSEFKHIPYESFDLLHQYPKELYTRNEILTIEKTPHTLDNTRIKSTYFENRKRLSRIRNKTYL